MRHHPSSRRRDRGSSAPDHQPLTADERRLLAHYRQIRPYEQKAVLVLVAAFVARARPPEVTPARRRRKTVN